MTAAACVLCDTPGGRLVFEAPEYRVVHADEAGFPAFYRVVWRAHAAEFTDLSHAQRGRCMDAVAVVEQCLRAHLSPDKINLAALGNAVPHLHWHVIARFATDSHFPGSVWAAAVRERGAAQELAIAGKLPALEHDIVQQLLALRSH
ncbi:HIT family protein [Variovorax ginsengisoli]|uniref:Diadenosine tetraphosphate (Ap4A) HIT family hydrolase n=1 Tax=Variovorax ginsengisoli TaxID=363844 RepID=A0ABT9S7B9_9BURK|nr:HIT family protein [Variovorax ginsengisoli]MDP9899794.1 diadenosine tetraphosphate (Ap4A) HIT family hydrolase [Variovorax ginsengisoli]